MSTDSDETYYGDETDCPMRIGLQDLREQDIFIDYTIKVEDRQFQVHKLVLASMSHYFRTLLTSALGQDQRESTTLDGVSAAVVEQLIECMYLNPMNITQDNAGELLSGAAYLQIPAAIDASAKFLVDNLAVDNCLETMSLFRAYSLPDSVKEVADFIYWNIKEILKDCVIEQLTYDDFSLIVESWDSSEWDLFLQVKKWIDTDYEKRKANSDDLLSKVRFSLLSPEQLTSIEEMQIYSDAQGSWTTLVNRATGYHQLPIHQKVINESDQTLVRMDACPIAFSNKPETKGYFYDWCEECWTEHDLLRTPNLCDKVYDVIEINNFLVVCVVNKQDSRQRWDVFDPRTMTWSTMGKMPTVKVEFAVVYKDKKLYTIGGVENGPLVSNGVEQYDFETNTWCPFATLPEALQNPSACVFQNAIYVSGGRNRIEARGEYDSPESSSDSDYPVLARVDCLNLAQKTWQSKADMLKRRLDHVMCVMKFNGEEILCVIDRDLQQPQLEYYDPGSDQWSRCSLMFRQELPTTLNCISKMNTVVQDNQIYIMRMESCTLFRGGGMCVILTFPEEEIEDRLEVQSDVYDEFPVETDFGEDKQFTVYGLLSLMPSS